MSKTMKDRWTDTGLVWVFFGIITLLLATATFFDWPHVDIYHDAVAATPVWGKALGALSLISFWWQLITLAKDNDKVSAERIAVLFVLLAAAISLFTGFYGSYR